MKIVNLNIMLNLKTVLFVCIIALSAAFANPLETIKQNDLELQSLIKKNKTASTQENTDRIKFLINDIFDFAEMGRRALGSSTWKAQDELKQQEFSASFKAMVENASVKKLEVYESERTEYEEADFSGTRAKIIAHVFSQGEETILEYKLKQNDGVWKAWDLVINDLSTMRNYREQFKTILKDKSFDELIQTLKDKSEQ